MNRHLIIGRFGSSDKALVPSAADEITTELNFVRSRRRLDYGIENALGDLFKLGVSPSEIGLDLLVLAAHVHAADTRVSRLTESQDSWTREIRLVVPVSDPDHWTNTSPVLAKLLNFLTGDRWIVGFRRRPAKFSVIVPQKTPQLIAPPFSNLSLFSGGLDSLVGAIDSLETGKTPLLISHAGEGATSTSQNDLFNALRNHYAGRHFNQLRLWMVFPSNLVPGVESEDTTRARSFLFFALGVFAGTGLNSAFTLDVPENGLIALNVPLDPLRLGALSTRTTHPFYISRWNELLQLLKIPGYIENPYWGKTKGEMLSGCANPQLLRQVTSDSLSCSSPTKGRWQGLPTQHCGYCLPCLIRRAAIETAFGQGADNTVYTVPDLKARALDTNRPEGQAVRSFQLAIRRLRAHPALASTLIHKPGPLTDENSARQAKLAEVYRRGLEEVGNLLSGVQTRPS